MLCCVASKISYNSNQKRNLQNCYCYYVGCFFFFYFLKYVLIWEQITKRKLQKSMRLVPNATPIFNFHSLDSIALFCSSLRLFWFKVLRHLRSILLQYAKFACRRICFIFICSPNECVINVIASYLARVRCNISRGVLSDWRKNIQKKTNLVY